MSYKPCPLCGRQASVKVLNTSEICIVCPYSLTYPTENKQTLTEWMDSNKEED